MCSIEKFEIKRGKKINSEETYDRKVVFYTNGVMFSLENGYVYDISSGNRIYKLNLPFSVKDIEYCAYGVFILSETGDLYIYDYVKMSLNLFINNVLGYIKNAGRSVVSNGRILHMNYVETTQGDILFRDICDVKICLSKPFKNISRIDHNDNFIVLLESDFTVKLIDIKNNTVLNSNIINEVPESFTNYGIKLEQGIVFVKFICPNGPITINVKFKEDEYK